MSLAARYVDYCLLHIVAASMGLLLSRVKPFIGVDVVAGILDPDMLVLA